ncbi:MAG: ABC transporter permease [Microbacterium sp.]|uniref:ABC transporter permease n=1 Tax=Microbacterium sp. TaxID=51671 RepID=UPI003D6FCC89
MSATTVLRPVAAAAAGGRRALPSPGVITAMIVLAALLIVGVIPGAFTSFDPLQASPASALQAPSAEHLFGTDQLGRDVFARVLYGAQYSLSLGLLATAIGLVGGILLGVVAGYSKGIADRAISRFLDILLAFPEVLLALILITILGPGMSSVIWAVGIGRIPGAARLVRSQVLQARGSSYVSSAVGLGLRRWTVVARHVVPNSLGPVLVNSVLGVGVCIIFGASLSFLGLGAVPPTPEWGLMLSEARQYLSLAPWISIWPGLFITLTVVSVTVTGRWWQQQVVSRRSSL